MWFGELTGTRAKRAVLNYIRPGDMTGRSLVITRGASCADEGEPPPRGGPD